MTARCATLAGRLLRCAAVIAVSAGGAACGESTTTVTVAATPSPTAAASSSSASSAVSVVTVTATAPPVTTSSTPAPTTAPTAAATSATTAAYTLSAAGTTVTLAVLPCERFVSELPVGATVDVIPCQGAFTGIVGNQGGPLAPLAHAPAGTLVTWTDPTGTHTAHLTMGPTTLAPRGSDGSYPGHGLGGPALLIEVRDSGGAIEVSGPIDS